MAALLQQPEVMLDLETMSVLPNAAVIAIGAVAFDRTTGAIGDWPFYAVVDLRSSQRCGGHIDADTVLWWMQQSDAARLEFASTGDELPVALQRFSQWMRGLGDIEQIKVWGDGSDFDNVILLSAYRSSSLNVPWRWWNNRCFRTLRKENPHVLAPAQEGPEHHALADAMGQVRHLLAIDAAKRGAA